MTADDFASLQRIGVIEDPGNELFARAQELLAA